MRSEALGPKGRALSHFGTSGNNAMGCRCNERREAIVRGIKAVADGDMQALADQARVFSKTVKEDSRDIRNKIAAGRASLTRR